MSNLNWRINIELNVLNLHLIMLKEVLPAWKTEVFPAWKTEVFQWTFLLSMMPDFHKIWLLRTPYYSREKLISKEVKGIM